MNLSEMKYDKNTVSVIVPTKNEGVGIQKIIQALKPYCGEIIIVDANSNDNTKEIAKAEQVQFFLDDGRGKGSAMRIGIKKAKNPILVFFDADGSPNEKDIPKLVNPILQKKADMVISSRRTGGSFDFNLSISGILRTMGSDFMAYVLNKRLHTTYSDILYCFRAIKKSTVATLQLSANTFDIEQEMLIHALKKGATVVEIPSRENSRKWGKSKLTTIAGVKLLFLLVKELYW